MKPWILLSCLGVSLVACVTTTQGGSTTGSTQQDTQPAVVSNEPVQIFFRAEVHTRSGDGISIDSERAALLHSGDKVAFYVTVTQQAFVYVGVHSADGEQALLYPDEHDAQTEFAPGTEYRVPGMGRWLELDQEPGQEDIFVYASRKMLSKDEALSLLASDRTKIKRARVAAAEPKPKPKSKPKSKPKAKPAADADEDAPGMLATRGLKMVETEPVEVKGGGVSSKHFVIRHQK